MLIGKGTTREVYDLGNGYVKKVHTHPLGYEQSLNEYAIYNELPEHFKPHFNEIMEVTVEYQICRYVQPYTSDTEPPFDITICEEEYIPYQLYDDSRGFKDYSPYANEIREWLIECDVAVYELDSTSNFGIVNNQRVFIDYGMTNDLIKRFELELQNGNLPYFTEERCDICGNDTRFIEYQDKTLGHCTNCGTVEHTSKYTILRYLSHKDNITSYEIVNTEINVIIGELKLELTKIIAIIVGLSVTEDVTEIQLIGFLSLLQELNENIYQNVGLSKEVINNLPIRIKPYLSRFRIYD